LPVRCDGFARADARARELEAWCAAVYYFEDVVAKYCSLRHRSALQLL
jgi:hypothetical protein